jgi:hypothetical protein
MKSVEKDLLRIEIILMPRSGLMIGICETLRSLVVTGRNERELDRCLPSAIEYHLERRGFRQIRVTRLTDSGTSKASPLFRVRRFEIEYTKEPQFH